MAERRAMNKYYPPDWDPSKGSLNRHVSRDPLGGRRRNDGLIVRMELPFGIWCQGSCDELLAKGLRFNAIKKRDGEYLGVPIWILTVKCPHCQQEICLRTDPKHADYTIVSGGRRQQMDSTVTESDELKEVQLNPFSRLEQQVLERQQMDTQKMNIERLLERSDRLEHQSNTFADDIDGTVNIPHGSSKPKRKRRMETESQARSRIRKESIFTKRSRKPRK